MNLYELLNKEFKWPVNKEVKVFESFAGVGAQAKALKRIHAKYKIVGISEIDKNAIVSYAAIHCNLNEKLKDHNYPSKMEMIRILQNKDVGFDFKTGKHTITEKTPIDKIKRYYLADQLSNNLGNISKIKAEMLPNIDLFTYSFPCQDLSRAGNMRGMNKEDHTRSGLLWEIERILDEGSLDNRIPRVLVMENVPEVIGTRNKKNFMLWFKKLEQLGYQSYYKILDAKNHGIPQHRERCFMVSILGDCYYEFPKKKKLERRLIDMLEPTVELKYYLSYKGLKCFMDGADHNGIIRRKMFQPFHAEKKDVAKTITTRSGSRPCDNFLFAEEILCINSKMSNGKRTSQTCRIMDNRGLAVTLTCGYTGYYIVDDRKECLHETGDEIIGKVIVDGKELGVLDGKLVRRLTGLEAFRLMGFDDEDVCKIKQAKVSEGQILKQAGNSIVVEILEDLFSNLFEERGDDGTESV